MRFRRTVLGMFAFGLILPVANGAEIPFKKQADPVTQSLEKCERKIPPIGLIGAANQLLEAAQYAQWVLEDIVCKYPSEEEAKRALIKLNLAISNAEGQ